MVSIENEIIGIIFIFFSITISCIFNWKQIQLESLKYQLSPWLIICTLLNELSHLIIKMSIIESTKTTSMEDVSTGVLEKIKNIWEVKIKPKMIWCIKTYISAYVKIQKKKYYIERILCASKLHVFNLVLIFCPDSTDVAKYSYVVMNTL